MWVELPDAAHAAAHAELHGWLLGRAAQARAASQRPRNNRLTNVGQWLKDNKVVDNDNRVLVGLAFAFLAVCLHQHRGSAAREVPERRAGDRRAPRARRQPAAGLHPAPGRGRRSSRRSAPLLGFGLATLGLAAVQHMYAAAHLGHRGGYQELTHFDAHRRHVGHRARGRRGARRRAVSGVARGPPAARRLPEEPVRERHMNLNIRPILSALLRNRTGAVLVALQIAIALAVLVNALYIVISASRRWAGRRASTSPTSSWCRARLHAALST